MRRCKIIAFVLLGIMFLFLAGCNAEDSGSKPVLTTVVLKFAFLNHMQGQIMTAEKQVQFENVTPTFTLLLSDYALSGVSQKHAVLRDASGNRVAYTFTGKLEFSVPKDPVSQYTVILFDTSVEGIEEAYDWLANNMVFNMLKKNLKVYRQDSDGRTGPEEIWTGLDGAITQINNILQTPFSLGSLTTGGTEIRYGYGWCLGGDGMNGTPYILVDPNNIGNYPEVFKRIGVEEAAERYGCFNNILGAPSSMFLCFSQTGKITPGGERVIRFTAAYAPN